MRSIEQIMFWQTPFPLKLIAIWFCVPGIYTVWKIIDPCIGVKCEIEICSTLWSLISVFIHFGIAIGLVNRNNSSREWAIFFVSLGLIGLSLILAVVIFESLNSTEGFNISYDKVTQPQAIIILVTVFALHVGMLFTLMSSATKAFFILPANLESKQ
jgi:hypothetical protein